MRERDAVGLGDDEERGAADPFAGLGDGEREAEAVLGLGWFRLGGAATAGGLGLLWAARLSGLGRSDRGDRSGGAAG